PTAGGLRELARARDARDLPRILVRPVAVELADVRRRPGGARRGDGLLVRLREGGRLLEPHAPELAVGVPRRRDDGGVLDLPAPARLARVQAGRGTAHRNRQLRLGEI